MICRDGSVGAAGQTAPTKGYQPPLKMLFVVMHATTPLRRSQKGGTHSARAPSVLPHSDRQIERSSGTPCGSASRAPASRPVSNPLWSLRTGKTFFQQKVTLHQCHLTFLLTFTRFCDLLQITELAKCRLLHQLHIQASQHQGRI